MPSVADVVRILEEFAPPGLAEGWDKVGLLVAGDGRPVRRVLLAIDVIDDVLREAIEVGAGLVVGYHPLLFRPLERLDGSTWQCRVALGAVRAGIAVHSPHTALDATPGGVNDWLLDRVAEASGGAARDRRALVPAARPGPNSHRIVVFVPEEAADRVREALAAAGAGEIGAYSHCSFSSPGAGTFFGRDGARPAVGEARRLERVPEVRLEMPLPRARIAGAIAALRAAHPYEEPAFDLYPLEVPSDDPHDPHDPHDPFASPSGAGRVATLERPTRADALADALAPGLGVPRIARSRGADALHARVAVCAGSGASLFEKAAAAGATLFVTGEASHHDVLRAHALGLELLLAGHTNTERGYLPVLAARLAADPRAAGVEFAVSRADVDPLT